MPDKKEKSINVDRQAIIVIHGIGEQRPMDTLRDFVQSIAPPIPPPKDADKSRPAKRTFFNKPDVLSDTFELRRLTANAHDETFKTDYFEYYWAYKMSGTKLSDIGWWIKEILWRPKKNIPERIRWIYKFFWAGIILALLIGLTILVNRLFNLSPYICIPKPVASFYETFITDWLPYIKVILPVIWAGISFFLIYFLGDAVRYMTPRTGNIRQRQDIRATGIELLMKLHDAKTEVTKPKNGKKNTEINDPDTPKEEIPKTYKNKYDRIILVGHSLGSVIAYDLIKFLWVKHNAHLKLSPQQLASIEKAAENLKNKPDADTLKAYRDTQSELWESQHCELDSWRISDFITLGSPLAHAELLLAANPKQLYDKQEEREYPTCPPTPEDTGKFTFTDPETKQLILHHAAPFALTRWTNITFTKDFVGGNIDVFGKGIENHFEPSESNIKNRIPFWSHIGYWSPSEPKMVKLIREKLRLRIFQTGKK